MKIAIIAIGLLAVCGCENIVEDKEHDKAWTDHGLNVVTKIVELEGHKYVLMDGYSSGGIIHAESCKCKWK